MENKLLQSNSFILKIVLLFVIAATAVFISACSSSGENGWNDDYKYELDDNHKWDKEKFKEDMTKLKKELKSIKENKIKFKFDNEEFRRGMKVMKEELSKMKDKDFHLKINKEEMKKNIEKACKKLNDLDLDEIEADIQINLKDFNEEMEKLSEELSDMEINIDVDLNELENELTDLNVELENLDIDLSELKEEMKKLESFLDELKPELVEDGFIDDVEDDFSLNFGDDYLEINEEKVPDHFYEKYKNLYRKHFNKDPDGNFNIRHD